jgi:phosphatidylglycerophosphatase A
MSHPEASTPSTTTSSAERSPQSDRGKPHVSLAIATAFGLGYLPSAPGTFGSLAGMILAMSPLWFMTLVPFVASAFGGIGITNVSLGSLTLDVFTFSQCLLTVGVALIGVWTADRASKFWGTKDPQKVVIDEVSGQHLALLLGGFWPWNAPPPSVLSGDHPILWSSHPLGLSMVMAPNWKYLLLGFILFRVFDIWKPFPARQAESLPGGLGIMADDWIAGIYAALGLWIARAFGL